MSPLHFEEHEKFAFSNTVVKSEIAEKHLFRVIVMAKNAIPPFALSSHKQIMLKNEYYPRRPLSLRQHISTQLLTHTLSTHTHIYLYP